MKAITLWQPWASAIALGFKNYETRGWETKYRGTIAIHAGTKQLTNTIIEHLNGYYVNGMLPFYLEKYPQGVAIKTGNILEKMPYGSIIAIADLVDCIYMDKTFIDSVSQTEKALGLYEVGRYAWKLENVKVLETPVYAKGKQRLWEIDL